MVRSLAVTEPAPSPSSAAPSAGDGGTAAALAAGGLGAMAGPLGLVLVAGLALPPHAGLLLPMGLVAAMVVVGERRLRLVAEARAALDHASPLARAALCAGALGSVAVLSTVLARGVGSLVVDVPAALWGAGATVLGALAWALVGGRLPARVRSPLLLVLALAVPVAGVVGTRYEASGPYAQGWAHSGPILGIHPFQMTSIVVDGEGPFDLPINDYVEPDGSRGYGPQALADALDRALASIAERVYASGPARVRRALVDAEVEAVETPGVWERLDRAPHEDAQPRFVVRSGSFGRGSRVEFVCPGRRSDPRGPPGEAVMSRMCRDKYASEASAGLGVTGRWSGYVEARGQDRVGLHAWLELTRGDDAEGRRTLDRETRWWAWIVLGVVALVLLPFGGGRVGEGLRGMGGAVGALGVAGLVLAAVSGLGEPMVGLLPPAGPSWAHVPELAAWAPALALGSLGSFALDGPSSRGRAGRGGAGMIAGALGGPALLVLVSTLALAGSLPALAWIAPVRGAEGAQLLTFVRGVAEAIGEPGGLTIYEVEGAVASGLVGVLLGALVSTARSGLAAVGWLGGGRRSAWRPMIAMAVVLGVAALLVLSRKTAGAAALVPGVVGITLVLGSGLVRLAARPGAPRTGLGALLGVAAHLGWTALGGALVWAAVDPLPSHPFVTLCAVVGLVVVAAAGLAGLVGTGSSR